MAYTWEQLRKLSDADLIREHDARIGTVALGMSYFQEELARRDGARIAHQMRWMTLVITVCTVVVTISTIVLVVRAT